VALDEAYERHLAMMTSLRRAVADIAAARKRLEVDLAQRRSPADQDLLAELRARHAELRTAEGKLTADSQRLQAWLDGFRSRKEALQAAYTAAQARYAVNEVHAALAPDGTQPEVPFPGADEAVSSARSAAGEFLGVASGSGSARNGSRRSNAATSAAPRSAPWRPTSRPSAAGWRSAPTSAPTACRSGNPQPHPPAATLARARWPGASPPPGHGRLHALAPP
jgi:hypothetical protein